VTAANKANDEVWRRLVDLVMETRDDWRRALSDATGLPFGRVRVLRRLDDGPLTLGELAEATGSDAPATTVTVNALEAQALVTRKPHPTNRRAKLVSLTAEGRATLAKARKVIERAPAAFAAVTPADLAALRRVLDMLEAGPALEK
jgi:DNA-binding MarR family transcriptional regulator